MLHFFPPFQQGTSLVLMHRQWHPQRVLQCCTTLNNKVKPHHNSAHPETARMADQCHSTQKSVKRSTRWRPLQATVVLVAAVHATGQGQTINTQDIDQQSPWLHALAQLQQGLLPTQQRQAHDSPLASGPPGEAAIICSRSWMNTSYIWLWRSNTRKERARSLRLQRAAHTGCISADTYQPLSSGWPGSNVHLELLATESQSSSSAVSVLRHVCYAHTNQLQGWRQATPSQKPSSATMAEACHVSHPNTN